MNSYEVALNEWKINDHCLTTTLNGDGNNFTVKLNGPVNFLKTTCSEPKKKKNKKNKKKKPYFERTDLKVVNGCGRGGVYPNIKKVIFNEPATIVLWKDGSKTVVRCRDREHFDRWTGLAMCFMKKIFGDDFHHVMKTYAGEENE